MKKRAKRDVFLNFTDRELKVIELRTHGVEVRDIAHQTGVSVQAIYSVLDQIYPKIGFHNLALMTRWAIETGLDTPAPPDTSETAPVKHPRVRRGRIKLGRIRRAANPR